MLRDMIQPPEQLPIEDISSPSARMFEFCDQGLFPETQQISKVSSYSNCCFEDNYTTNPSSSFSSFHLDIGNSNNNNCNNHFSTSIDFSSPSTFSVGPMPTTQQEQFDLSTVQSQRTLMDLSNGPSPSSPNPVFSLKGPPLPSLANDECLSPLPSYVCLDPLSPSCSFLDSTMGPLLPGNLSRAISDDALDVFARNILMGSDLQPQELNFQGDNCEVYNGSDLMQPIYSSGDLQVLNNDTSQLVNGGDSSILTSEISNLEESSYKVTPLSVEERKEKIQRYMKKRNERNFSKKIKEDLRRMVNLERPSSSSHEDEEDEEVAVKEEEAMVDSSDIFPTSSGVSSHKCIYPL